MKRSQVNRATVLRRSTASTPNDVPAFRSVSTVHATGPVRRSRAVSLTATQRNSEGHRSEWSASPEFFTDPKWSATCSTVV